MGSQSSQEKSAYTQRYVPFPIDIYNVDSYVDQLKCIFEYLGSPSDEIVKRIARGKVSGELNLTTMQLILLPQARKYVRSLPIYRTKPLKFPKSDEQGA